jgi:cytochrome c oxidase subunit 2
MHDAYVIVAVIAVIAVVAINVALVGLVMRNRAERGREPEQPGPGSRGIRPGFLAAGIGLLGVLVFTIGVVLNDNARAIPKSKGASADQPPLRIRVAGQQWLWRYTYPDGTFSYYQLVVPVGRTVRLAIDSTDVVHRWWVPALAGMSEAVPGRLNVAYFRADDPGEYDGQSSAFSGASYAAERIRVLAVSKPKYEAWLAAQKRDLLAAQAFVQKEVGEQAAGAGSASAPLTPGVAPQVEGQ